MSKSKSILLLIALFVALTAAACHGREQATPPSQPAQSPVIQQPGQPSQPTIKIMWPQNGARVKVGQPFQVHAVATDPRGVFSIGIAVDGQPGTPGTASPPLTTFSAVIPITFQTKGVHTIAVQANSTTGAKSEPASIKVVAVQNLSDAPAAGDPPAPAPEVPSGPPPAPPADQPPPPPPPPGATVNFVANPTSIAQGQCSTLRWDVEGVREIYFEGVGVTGHEQRQQCPTRTTTYTLRVVFTDGSTQNYTQTVTVTGGNEGGALTINPATTFTVSNVTVSVNRSSYNGPCPNTFTASAKITTNGAGTVKYRWERSDGTNSDARTLQFDAAGEKSVTNYDWSIPSSGNYWVRLHVLEPNDLASNRGETTWTCTGGSGGQAPPAPRNCRGGASATSVYLSWEEPVSAGLRTWNGFRVYARGSNQPLQVFDNATVVSGAIENLTPNTTYHLDVRAYNAFGESPADACAVEVKTAAALTFQVTKVTAEVEPEIFTGTCPKSATYTGKITTNGAGTVSYRWVRSDGTSETRMLNFSAAGTQAVTSANVNYTHSATHWAKLEVLAPNAMTSDQAKFTLNCTSPAIVTLVSVSINPTAFTGSCPHTFHFTGIIRTNAAGTVTYRWERSDGNSDTRTLTFSAAGDKTVESGDFKSGSSGTFWARLHVLTPNDKVSNQATFTLTCK